jgi:predicted fused transcriptional regulator/phosphomethylpyrimidine kinase
LDLEPDRVTSILCDFLRLQKMHNATTILKENKDNLSPFVKLLEEVEINITRVKDIKKAMDSIISIKTRISIDRAEGDGPINRRG